MWTVRPVENSAKGTFLLCISKESELDNTRMAGVANVIHHHSEHYKKLAQERKLNEFPKVFEVRFGDHVVSISEMKMIYEYRMVGAGQPGRRIYDKIMLAARLQKCPLCWVGQVTNLDHYLPKSFCSLTVAPINLIPVCKDCNFDKLAKTANKPEETWLHPYFDNVECDRWLEARLERAIPPSARYYVQRPSNWDETTFQRACSQFRDLGLASRYSKEAAVRMRGISLRLKGIHKDCGASGVSEYLMEEAVSFGRVNRNSWDSVLYEALARDDWFCVEGFDKFD